MFFYTVISVGQQFFGPRTPGSQDPFQGVYKIKIIFILVLKHHLPPLFTALTLALAVRK